MTKANQELITKTSISKSMSLIKKKTKEKENLSFLSSNYQVSKYTSFLSDYVVMCDE